MRLCYALNHEKLSAESLQHLGQNSKFPSITSLQVFITQESKHSSSISNCLYYIKRVDEFRICREHKEDPHEPVRPLARKHEHSRETGVHLQQMQCRVAELENACTVLQSQVPNVTEQRFCNSGKFRSLPKLCSWYKWSMWILNYKLNANGSFFFFFFFSFGWRWCRTVQYFSFMRLSLTRKTTLELFFQCISLHTEEKEYDRH